MNMFRTSGHLVRSFALGLALVLTGTEAPLALAQTSAPLLQKADLVYQGAFRVPQGLPQPGTFSVGGTALGFNPIHNSLFVVGHDWYQQSAEISIPAITNSSDISRLATATLLQPFKDATEGRIKLINPSDPNAQKIGGQFVYGGNLYVTGYSFYDGNVTQSSSHFVRPLDLSSTGQVKGPFVVGSLYPGFVGGYMTTIPLEWQSAFGGPALTGNCCVPGGSWESQGPAAAVFDPAQLGKLATTPATPVVGYPYPNVLGPGEITTNPFYNLTTRVTGIVFSPGTRSVLFFGKHGKGTYCYGEGTADTSLVGKLTDGGANPWCYDPAESSKGTHAYPYVYQVWAYDANDLLAVKNGTKKQYEIRPYSVWNFNLPFEQPGDQHLIGGAVLDPATGKIYVSQQGSDADYTPIIHVFTIGKGVAPSPAPNPPTNLTVR